MVDGEQSFKVLSHLLFFKLSLHSFHPEVLRYLLKNYFQEHSSSCSGRFRLQDDNLEDCPVNGKAIKQVPKKSTKVSDFIHLQLEDSIVMVDKGLDEEFLVKVIDRTKSFRQQTEEILVNSFHHATFNDHIHQFVLISLGNVHLEQLVGTLFKIESGLDN